MRTVILNTLGSELRQTPLFYLPFREEQFLWVEHDMADIASAAESICAHSHKQNQIQDYHLVVLVSLAHYPYARYQWLRKTCEELLFAHLRNHLLLPLAQTYKMPPKAASVVFVVPKRVDGTGDVPQEEQFDALLSFRNQTGPVERLLLIGDDATELDLSDLFAESLNDYTISRENEINYRGNEAKQYALQAFRKSLGEKLASLQSCRYVPVGEETPKSIPVEKLEMFPQATSWELFCIDLQMNLCDHLASNTVGNTCQLQLQAHDDDTICQTISLALKRVQYLRNAAPRESYVPLVGLTDNLNVEQLPLNMWSALQENTELPGVAELKSLVNHTLDLDTDFSEKDIPVHGVRLQRSWLHVQKEKKYFQELCDILDGQFDTAVAQEQQKTVLDTCAGIFAQWRVQMVTRPQIAPPRPELSELPEFDSQKAEEQLAQAQAAYSNICVDKLEDYDDLRQEAEHIKSKARQLGRLWPEDSSSPTRMFLRYSAVLGLCFLLMMLLPYICITLGLDTILKVQYIYFAVTAAVFVLLYLAGVVLWLRSLCSQLSACSRQMYQLLQRSHARRRESIVHAISAYGRELPRCTIQYENLQQLLAIHDANLQRKRHFHTHMRILDKAEEYLIELHTLLRLPMDNSISFIETKRQVNYQKAPNDPVNVPCYIFLSEKWGC